MFIYLVMFMGLMILAIINIYVKKEKLKFFYIVFAIFLVAITALRKNLGGSDYFVYKNYFQNTPNLFDIKSSNYFIEYEIGYKYLNSIMKIFTDNHIWLFLIIAICTLPIILKLNYKYCEYPFFTLCFYMYKTFFYTNFVAMRQTIAITIFVLSLKYIFEGKFKKYVINILIASLFHSSSIVLIGLYFFRSSKLYKLNIIKIISIGIILNIFSDKIIFIIQKIMIFLSAEDNVTDKIESISGVLFLNLHVIEIVIIYLLFRKYYLIKTNKDRIILNLFIGYCILLIGFSTQVIFIRISMYFYFITMIFISKSLENIKNIKFKTILMYALMIVFLVGYIKYLYQFDSGGLMPYRWIL